MDPTEYTSADAYAEHVANNLPDLSEVSAAALALIKAIRKLENNSLVASVEPIDIHTSWIGLDITETLNFDEDERFPMVIRDAFIELVEQEEKRWIAAIEREATDAKLTQPTIDLAGMVMGILGGKS